MKVKSLQSKSKSNTIPSPLLDLVPTKGDHKKYDEYYKEECTRAIRRLVVQYLDKKITGSIKKTDDPSQLTNPSYAYLQAFQSGYRQALAEIKDTLNR